MSRRYETSTTHLKKLHDGNGRTARLLTTLLLHRAGYGLKGIYSLEEYYAENLAGYYAALAVGPSHSYFGRAEADVTGFIKKFCQGMAVSFAAVRAQTAEAARRGAADYSPLLRQLDPRQRRLLVLFQDRQIVTTGEIAAHLGLSPRTVVALCRTWLASGFLVLHDPSRKNRSYQLAPEFERPAAATPLRAATEAKPTALLGGLRERPPFVGNGQLVAVHRLN